MKYFLFCCENISYDAIYSDPVLTVEKCLCPEGYTGREQFVLNLDNKNINEKS